MGYAAHHKSQAGDSGPGVGEGGAGELKLTEMAGEHDRHESDTVIGDIGDDHGEGEEHLVLGLLHVHHLLPPSWLLITATLVPAQQWCCCSIHGRYDLLPPPPPPSGV